MEYAASKADVDAAEWISDLLDDPKREIDDEWCERKMSVRRPHGMDYL